MSTEARNMQDAHDKMRTTKAIAEMELAIDLLDLALDANEATFMVKDLPLDDAEREVVIYWINQIAIERAVSK